MKFAIVLAVCLCAVALVQARPGGGRKRGGGRGGRGGGGAAAGAAGAVGAGRRGPGRNPVKRLTGLCKALELEKTEDIPVEWDALVGEFEEDICTPLFAVLAEKNEGDDDDDDDSDDGAFGCAGRRRGGRGRGGRGQGGRRRGADNDNDEECPPINVQEGLTGVCSALDNMPETATPPPQANQDMFNVLLSMGDICDQVDLLNPPEES